MCKHLLWLQSHPRVPDVICNNRTSRPIRIIFFIVLKLSVLPNLFQRRYPKRFYLDHRLFLLVCIKTNTWPLYCFRQLLLIISFCLLTPWKTFSADLWKWTPCSASLGNTVLKLLCWPPILIKHWKVLALLSGNENISFTFFLYKNGEFEATHSSSNLSSIPKGLNFED